MPKNKYFAEFEGQTFTRNSDRTYTHVVIGRWKIQRELNSFKRSIVSLNEEMDGYKRVISSGVVPASYRNTLTIADYERFVANSPARIADLQARVEALEARIAAGEEFFSWGVVGWCSRYDLAMKQCKCDDNRILEVQKR